MTGPCIPWLLGFSMHVILVHVLTPLIWSFSCLLFVCVPIDRINSLLPNDLVWMLNDVLRRRDNACLFFCQVCCPDLASCIFVLEQAVSVRALQEMVNTTSSEQVNFAVLHPRSFAHFENHFQSSANQGGQTTFRTLLYGHAVLLRHYHSQMVDGLPFLLSFVRRESSIFSTWVVCRQVHPMTSSLLM